MEPWKKTIIYPDATILDAIKVIDASSLQIALVVKKNYRLLGTVTDGDIRRSILKGISLSESVKTIMNKHPLIAASDYIRSDIIEQMEEKKLRRVPIVDVKGRVVDMLFIESLIRSSTRDNWVVIMAGGEGTRLRPMTEDCPKPMLQVGGKPIIETILENFIEFGFKKFFFAVNYMSEKIENYFADGAGWNVQIDYLREQKKLGTAGALSLLPVKPTAPFVVMNGDILSRINFDQLMDFHQKNNSVGTMCVKAYDFQVPFGVAKVENYNLLSLEEKPIQRFFINAGIYVLNPDVLNFIEPNAYCDMPTVYSELIKQQKETIVFPIREYWLDLGQMEDFARAQSEYTKVFE